MSSPPSALERNASTIPPRPRGIVVLDIGATNARVVLLDEHLRIRAEQSVSSSRTPGPPYLAIDTDPVVSLAKGILPEFDQVLPVDAIVPCAHGSAAALLDDRGELTLPIMSYEAEPPAAVVDGYSEIAPAFEEVLAPTNPMGLTLARQLYWQESEHSQEFARARTIMPLAQYIAFRLCGVRANEVSAMGAQTHLWAPMQRSYSTLAVNRGWASRFPGIRPAWDSLARVHDIALRGRGLVLVGVHDSNANLTPYLGDTPSTLLSTGTWIIGFAQGIEPGSLDPERDQVSNTTVFGDPIASCRFMGGREYEILADGAPPNLADIEIVSGLLRRGVTAWPSFTVSGGPAPGTGGRGHIDGVAQTDAERASLASLYCAQMSALALKSMGGKGAVVVDGPFSSNDAYLRVLAACLPDQDVFTTDRTGGTAGGRRAGIHSEPFTSARGNTIQPESKPSTE